LVACKGNVAAEMVFYSNVQQGSPQGGLIEDISSEEVEIGNVNDQGQFEAFETSKLRCISLN